MNRHDRLPAVVLAAGLLGPLAAAGGLAAAALARSPLDADAQPAHVVAVVERAERFDPESSPVTWVAAESVPVRSHTAGTVTAVHLVEGGGLVDGDVVLEVDGLPVLAFVAPAPLYRDVVEGLSGQDVLSVQQFLRARGFRVTADGTAGPSTARAIAAFNSRHGRSGSETLEVSSVLWVPETVGPPVGIVVRVGDVIEPQTEVFVASDGQDRVEVTAREADVERTLAVGDVEVRLEAGSTTVTDQHDVNQLRAAMAGEPTAGGVLTRVEPRVVGTIPASAVVVDRTGTACFFTGPGGDAVPIEVTESGFGLVDVDEQLIGSPVLVDPRGAGARSTCA